MSLRIDDDKLLEMYKIIWTKIEDLKNIELNALIVYDDRYIKSKRTNDYKIYTFFYLYVTEFGVECKTFTAISIDSLIVYENNIIYIISIFRQMCL